MLNGNTIKGMVWDTHSDVTGEQSYSFVFNGNLHSHSSEQSYPFISNNTSNIECVNFEKGYKVIGLISIKELNTTILALYNEETNFKLFLKVDYQKKDLGKGDSYEKTCKGITILQNEGVTTECNYSELLYTNCFNWNNEYPLRFEYQITDTTLNLYIVNGLDQDRFISFLLSDFSLDKDFKLKPISDDCDQSYINGLNCEKTLWYPHVDSVKLSTQKIDGGSKKAGKYFYLFAYSTNKGIPLTPFTSLDSGLSLFSIGKEDTEEGIKITVSNVADSSRYRYYTLAVVESIKGVTTYRQLGTYPINQTTIYDWDNSGNPIGLPVLMTQYPFYKYSKSITESNNILFRAGLSEFEKFNLQPVISEIETEWGDTVLMEGDYKEENNMVSHLRGENYVYGIEILLDNMEKGPTYLLVPRNAVSSDLTPTTDTSLGLTNVPRWVVKNTATKEYQSPVSLEALYNLYKQTGESHVYRSGKFGYFESTEKYPNIPEVWGPLCGKNIRLFKYPDIETSSHFTNGDSFGKKNYIHPIGLKIKSDMNAIFNKAVVQGLITQEQRDRITGWKVVRGDRSGNNSIIAKGLFYDMWRYTLQNKDENFATFGGESCTTEETPYGYFPNYPFNDLRDDPYLTEDFSWYIREQPRFIQSYDPKKLKFVNTKKYTFHSPDTHFTNPTLGTEVSIDALAKGTAKGYFNQAEDQAKHRLLGWKHYNIAISIAKYIASLQNSPVKEEVQALATNVGNSVGNVVGGVASAFGPIGSAVGGVLKAAGGLIGGLVGRGMYENNPWFQFVDSSFRTTITFQETEKLIDIFRASLRAKQYSYQYQAIGDYNNLDFSKVPTSPNRKIDVKSYLGNGKYTIENDNINNFNRESSVYLKLNEEVAVVADADKSKILLSDEQAYDEDKVYAMRERIECEQLIVESIIGNPPGHTFCNSDPNYSIDTDSTTTVFTFNTAVFAMFCQVTLLDSAYYPSDLQTNTEYILGGQFPTDENFVIQPGYLNTEALPTYKNIVEVRLNAAGIKVLYHVGTRTHYAEQNSADLVDERPPGFNNCVRTFKVIGEQTLVCIHAPDTQERLPCLVVEDIIYRKIPEPCMCNVDRYTDIASYYGSMKRRLPDQYGTIYDIKWLNTSSGPNTTNTLIFGGDTFIGRFSLKRKHSFFNQTLFGNPEDSEINYSLLGNAANAIYYIDKNPIKEAKAPLETNVSLPIGYLSEFNRHLLLNLLEKSVFKVEEQVAIPKFKLDCASIKDYQAYTTSFDTDNPKGYMYLYNYGVVSFITESNINLDLRDKGKNLEEDFYPNISNLDTWLQEKNVSPATDNVYIYDRSYSKQPSEELHYMYDINFRGSSDKILHNNRVIYSAQGAEINDDDYSDPFLINRALDYYDFSKKHGDLTSIEGIEGDKVFVRQEHNSSIFGAYITLNSDQNTVLISSGAIFNNKPVEYAVPSLGYFGSQHQTILHTPFGHITADAIRGQVFQLGNGGQNLEEISNKGMFSFFKEFLPFQISRYFKEVNVDNNFNGVGLTMVYDNRFQVFHITKLDYIPLFKEITFKEGKYFFKNKEVTLSNSNYFCNVSWTISYSFVEQRWYSFQPFIPNFYIEHIDYFDSGIDTGIWRHNVTNKSYQSFYGKLYPFIVETMSKFDGQHHLVNNVNYYLDVIQYMNKYDKVFRDDLSFNKAILSTDSQASGLLELHPKSNNLYLESRYPIKHVNKTDIKLNIKEGLHSFNQFRDIAKFKNIPLWKRICDSYFEEINADALDNTSKNVSLNTIIGNQVRLRLIQDKEDKYQFIFKGSHINDLIKKRF